MAQMVDSLLDKAKIVHSLSSDYKLALVMGIDNKSLSNYRHGKTLPDARVISKICELTGDDPAQILVEMEAARAKTPEARALWSAVAERLAETARHGVTAGVAAAVFSVGSIGVQSPAAAGVGGGSSQVNTLYIVEGMVRVSPRSLGPLLDL